MPSLRNVFAENALDLHRHGLCVLPIGDDRTPCVKGFQNWKTRPSRRTLEKWIDEHGDSNIAIVPGLSNVTVADSDDLSQDAAVVELLGETPLRVLTNRGRHRYYRRASGRLPADLRGIGLNVDLKAGNSVVIAPPSVHETGTFYRLEDCDWSAKKDLPPMRVDKLESLDRGADSNGDRQRRQMRDGSRGQWLNDRLCCHGPQCNTFNELLDIARTLGAELADNGYSPLEEREVVQRAQKVWRDVKAGKIQPLSRWHGSASSIKSAIERLCQLDKRGADAFTLLLKLQTEHMARCRRGETFCITPVAMVKNHVIPRWTRERYQKARDLLLQAQLIVTVAVFQQARGGRRPAQYALACTRAAELGYVGPGG